MKNPTKTRIPQQGDIFWVNLSPTKGHEQHGMRPCYVVTPEIYNQIGLCLVCPITSQVKGYGSEFPLPEGSQTTGVILVDHLRNVDWEIRSVRWVERLPLSARQQVAQRLTVLIEPR